MAPRETSRQNSGGNHVSFYFGEVGIFISTHSKGYISTIGLMENIYLFQLLSNKINIKKFYLKLFISSRANFGTRGRINIQLHPVSRRFISRCDKSWRGILPPLTGNDSPIRNTQRVSYLQIATTSHQNIS